MANNINSRRFSRRTPVDKQKLASLKISLAQVGASRYDLLVPETKYLVNLLEDDEEVVGAIYGRHPNGRGALFITPTRVIFVDKKPLFTHFDEFTYLIVSAVNFTQSGPYAIVTVKTRGGDFVIKTMNMQAAENFVKTIEKLAFKPGQQNNRTNYY